MKLFSAIILFATVGLAGCTLGDEYSASSDNHEAKYVRSESRAYIRTTSAGDVLTTPDGMTVYTYDKEARDQPSCLGKCAEDWFPVLAPKEANPVGQLKTVEGIDGTRQWAYRGKPLYIYREDKAPGDVNGDNTDGFWHVVKFSGK